MGKVQFIKASRKEFKCMKCGNIIPKGSSYYRGTLNFNPDIIRCDKCGLSAWEVTTSDYQLQVGEIVYRWGENYEVDETTPEALADELRTIQDDLQERLDNMPEQLQDSETGETLQSRIDSLESAISDLEDIDTDSIKQGIIDEVNTDEDEELTWDKLLESDDIIDAQEEFNNNLTEAIEEALSNIEV